MVSNFALLLCLILIISSASTNDEILSKIQVRVEPQPPYFHRPIYQEELNKLFPNIIPERMMGFIKTFSSIHSRSSRIDKGQAETWLKQEIRTALSHYKAGTTYFREIDSGWDAGGPGQKNLIGIFEGQDPDLKGNLVILGAHYNTYPNNPSQRSPGADHNASGCAVLMEVLHLISQFGIRFKNTVEFHFYTGREQSVQYGSPNVIRQYENEDRIHLQMGDKRGGVKGMLNVDTVGYQKEKKAIGFCSEDLGNGDSMVNLPLPVFVGMLISEYSNYERKFKAKDCYSDFNAWTKKGYQATIITEYIRWYELLYPGRDTLDIINVEQITEFAKVALAFVIELGEVTNSSYPVFTTTDEGSDTGGASMPMKIKGFWAQLGLGLIGIWMLYNWFVCNYF